MSADTIPVRWDVATNAGDLMRFRIWLGTHLALLGAWVIGVPVEEE